MKVYMYVTFIFFIKKFYFIVLTVLLPCSKGPVCRVPWGKALLGKQASLGHQVPVLLQRVAIVFLLLITEYNRGTKRFSFVESAG